MFIHWLFGNAFQSCTQVPYLIIDDAFQIFVGGRTKDAQDMVQLIQIMLARENRTVGQHFSQNAADRPDVNRFRIALNLKE